MSLYRSVDSSEDCLWKAKSSEKCSHRCADTFPSRGLPLHTCVSTFPCRGLPLHTCVDTFLCRGLALHTYVGTFPCRGLPSHMCVGAFPCRGLPPHTCVSIFTCKLLFCEPGRGMVIKGFGCIVHLYGWIGNWAFTDAKVNSGNLFYKELLSIVG